MNFSQNIIQFLRQIICFLCCCCRWKCRKNNNRVDGQLPQVEGGGGGGHVVPHVGRVVPHIGRVVQHGSNNKRFKKFSHFYVEVKERNAAADSSQIPDPSTSEIILNNENENIQSEDPKNDSHISNQDKIDLPKTSENSNFKVISASHDIVDNHHNDNIAPNNLNVISQENKNQFNFNSTSHQTIQNRQTTTNNLNSISQETNENFNINSTSHQSVLKDHTTTDNLNLIFQKENRFKTQDIIEVINPIVIPRKKTPLCICEQGSIL